MPAARWRAGGSARPWCTTPTVRVSRILTERDVLASIGMGQDPDAEHVRDHLTGDLVYAAPTWTLEQAADAMVRGGFRHLVVLDQGEVAGILSVRDIVRCWSGERRHDELVG